MLFFNNFTTAMVDLNNVYKFNYPPECKVEHYIV